MVQDVNYKPPGTQHYNVRFKGGASLNRVTAREISGLRPADIEWIWIVGERRNATPEEIRKLSKSDSKR